MDKEFIITYIQEKNYWWKKATIEKEDKGIKRDNYIDRILKIIPLDRIICLSGIRRCGKTTLLYQLTDTLLQQGKNPKQILYIKLDDLIGKIEDIRDIIQIYQELTGIDPKKEQIFFIIDEIQVQNNWQYQLKYFIDGRYKSKFIISGSSKTLLYKNASESLAGRIRFIDIFPLTFSEFITFNEKNIDIKHIKSPTFENIQGYYHQLLPNKEVILHLLRTYKEVGGFPEWFTIKNKKQWHQILFEDYLSLILFKDIVFTYKIKDPFLLEKMVSDLASFSTNRANYSKLSDRLDADRETIKLYLHYLESSGLIFTAEVYFKSKKARERIAKKIYFWEEGLRKAITLDTDDGKAMENIVAWHTMKYMREKQVFSHPSYWKNTYEVDFILDIKKPIPIEVKYQHNPTDIKGLIEFCKKFKTEKGIVVTKDTFKKETIENTEVWFIPLWLYLLIIETGILPSTEDTKLLNDDEQYT